MFKNFYSNFKFIARHIPLIALFEDDNLQDDFNSRVIAIKEYNSQVMYKTHYIPKAINAILKEENYLVSERGAMPRATAMMMSDMANGVIDEFYRLKEQC